MYDDVERMREFSSHEYDNPLHVYIHYTFLYPLNNLQVSVLRRTLLISGILMVCLVYYFINFSAPIASQTLHISSQPEMPEKQHSGIGSNTTNSSEPKKPEKGRSGNGYMFAVGYSDQGTGSFRNLMSILCLAGKLGGIRIVEPFMVGSFLGINVSKNWREEVKFGDLFDAGVANRYAKKNHFSELVPFEEFLEDAPRKLLVVQHRCVPCHMPCGHPRALEKGRIFADEHGFEAVGQVCLDYKESGKTKLGDITKQIYNMYDRSELTVMFIRFGGLQEGGFSPDRVFRLFISGAPAACYRGHLNIFPVIRPGKLVRQSADIYVERFLQTKYISVMIRIEMVLGSLQKDTEEARKRTKMCLSNLAQRLDGIRSKTGIGKIFVCLDVGKYGSSGLRQKAVADNLGPEYDSFLSQTLEDGMTLSKLDATFTNATLIDNPGFVAMMQKTIAARGDVLFLLGGNSNFQSSALELHQSMHKSNVFKINSSCK